MIHFRKHIIILLLTGLLFSCKKDVPPQRPASTGSITTGKKLIICNEGNFGTANSTVTLYDPASGGIVTDAYGPANANQYIGEVVQSMAKFNEKYYWVVNGSKKITITDKNFTKLGEVTGFTSPRYMEFVSNSKAYVSNLQLSTTANFIQVLDLNTSTISKNIRINGWTEHMTQSYGKVFVTNQRRKYLYIIDAASDNLTDSVYLNATSACIVKDQDEKLWISCNADAANNIPARLVKVDPVTHQVVSDISLQTTQNSISVLTINSAGNTLYYLLGDLYKTSVSSSSCPSNSLVLQGSMSFYGLCLDPSDETIYLSDAIDYNQDGNILRYKVDGSYFGTFKAGISPGFMWIEE
jgi:hypothetical protein